MLRIILLILSYLLGSIPFGWIVTYITSGKDIRSLGSGNIGATNVARCVGKSAGIFVFILDLAKGFLPPILIASIGQAPAAGVIILAGILAICGHNWPVFLRFKGGKGVATSLGVVSALSFIFPGLWIVLILSLISWVVVFRIWRYVSLASIIAGGVFFLSSLIISLPGEMRFLSILLFLFILVRHKDNIKRLYHRREHRL